MESVEQPLLGAPKPKGALWTLPFILANDAFEKLASFSLMANMILYLTIEYGMELSTGSKCISLWNAATNLTPFLFAILADSYLGRFRMISFGSVISLLGIVVLWCTSLFSAARPSCGQHQPTTIPCSATVPQLILLASSLVLMSIGSGGMRSSSLAFCADQIVAAKAETTAKEGGTSGDADAASKRLIASFLNWYSVTMTMSAWFAYTVVVYIQNRDGWVVGFGVPMVLMVVGVVSFFSASRFYARMNAKTTLFRGLCRVVVVWWKRRNMDCSSNEMMSVVYHCEEGSSLSIPSDKLSFLNKACMITSPEDDERGTPSQPWQTCTVEQVEELKALIKALPLWSTGIAMGINVSQASFVVLLANAMDRHILSIEIPPASFGIFGLLSLTVWIALYDRIILPAASNLAGKPVRLGVKARMGIGLLLSFASIMAAAVVERFRRVNAGGESQAVMSAAWLVPQHCLFGLAEAFGLVAQNEFFYMEFPRSMSSIATALPGLAISVGNMVAAVVVSAVDGVTSRNGGVSWVATDVNKAHIDYYYMVLATLSLLNLVYFLVCARAYGPCKGGQHELDVEEIG